MRAYRLLKNALRLRVLVNIGRSVEVRVLKLHAGIGGDILNITFRLRTAWSR